MKIINGTTIVTTTDDTNQHSKNVTDLSAPGNNNNSSGTEAINSAFIASNSSDMIYTGTNTLTYNTIISGSNATMSNTGGNANQQFNVIMGSNNAFINKTSVTTTSYNSIISSSNATITNAQNVVIINGSGVSLSTSNTTYLGGTVNIGGLYTLPSSAGSSGQVLTTNGSGVASWQTPSGSAPSGTVVLIDANETPATGTGNTTAQSYTLSSNSYSRIIIESEFRFINNANTNGTATFTIQVGGVSKRSMACNSSATGTGDQFSDTGVLKYSEAITGGGTITIITSGVANASWTVYSLRVYGVI